VSIVDVIVTIFLLGACGVVFSTTFPTGFQASRQAQHYKVASAIAQRKMEQLRPISYQSLGYNLLATSEIIDKTGGTLPYYFTEIDSLQSQLPDGIGELLIEDVPNYELKRVTVTVKWRGVTGVTRSVQLTTVFADKRARSWAPAVP
jgi:hypothetical protein